MTHCLTLAACYQWAQFVLKIGLGKNGEGGRVSAQGAVHMAAVLAGCRTPSVGTG